MTYQNSVFGSLPRFAATFPGGMHLRRKFLTCVESVATAMAMLNKTTDVTYRAADASSALFQANACH